MDHQPLLTCSQTLRRQLIVSFDVLNTKICHLRSAQTQNLTANAVSRLELYYNSRSLSIRNGRRWKLLVGHQVRNTKNDTDAQPCHKSELFQKLWNRVVTNFTSNLWIVASLALELRLSLPQAISNASYIKKNQPEEQGHMLEVEGRQKVNTFYWWLTTFVFL